MEKRTVIITGGSTGIGKATAIAFGKLKYNVIIAGRNSTRGMQTEQELRNNGYDVKFYQVDVQKEEEVEKLVKTVTSKYGKLDTIVNNAAAATGYGLLADTTQEAFRQMIDTNILGVYYGMKYAIKSMEKTGGGSIVNVASISGANGIPYVALYSATKHAVIGLTKSGALDYATAGIRINAIAPGTVKTEILQESFDSGLYSEESVTALQPIMRLGRPEEIAKGIVFLASEDASFMTGEVLFVDGGFNAK